MYNNLTCWWSQSITCRKTSSRRFTQTACDKFGQNAPLTTTRGKVLDYDVHPDMKSHMGMFISIGKGCAYTSSSKQKLNSKSSTEAKLVAIDYAMAQILCKRHILAVQGLSVPVTTIYQDNKSLFLYHRMARYLAGNSQIRSMYGISLCQTK